ncbi:MAG: PhnD/SsuA/transferrin family substrate-binding protein [Oscillospiraceae bacterium]
MSITRKIKGALAAVLCMGMLAGCASTTTSSAPESAPQSAADSSAADISTAEDVTSAPEAAPTAETPTAETEPEAPGIIRVAALKGPTAMGMIKLMDDNSENTGFEFTIAGAADEITPSIIQGNTDIACVPANLASVLYNKTEGGVKVLAVNTLGVLYIVQNGEPTIASVSDLAGKTIYASGKGATPEFALRYILTQNGLDPDNDVTIEWKTEHTECLSALLNDEGSAALLPQPFVTTAQTKNEGVSVVLDLNKEWENLNNGSALITGVVIARSEFAEQYPAAVDSFLNEYSASVEYVNANTADAAQLIGKFDIVPAAVAEKALPFCNIVFISGAEMKEKLSGYLNVLFDSEPTSVGGAVPADEFYYGA